MKPATGNVCCNGSTIAENENIRHFIAIRCNSALVDF